MILRPDYIQAVIPFMGQLLVKILPGIRRCGKYTIFEMLVEELKHREIPDHYPKYVVTTNSMDTGIGNGMRIVHLSDFLLAKSCFWSC